MKDKLTMNTKLAALALARSSRDGLEALRSAPPTEGPGSCHRFALKIPPPATERRSATGFRGWKCEKLASPWRFIRSRIQELCGKGGFVLRFAAALLLFPLGLPAQINVSLPFGGVAPGYELTVPIEIPADDTLFSVEFDLLFDAARLSCTTVESGTTGFEVTGSGIGPGRFRIAAHSLSEDAFTENVICNVTFSALAAAANGRVVLRSATNHFRDDLGLDLPGSITPGLILVGDAFGFVPEGGRAQFRGLTGSNYVIETSENLATWTPLVVSTAEAGLVWVVDTNLLAQCFYRAAPVRPPGLGQWIQVASPTTNILAGVAFGNGITVAVGNHGTAIYSLDGGSNWVAGSVGTNEALMDVAFGNGCFVACGLDGGIYRSTNGVIWGAVCSLGFQLLDVAFAHGTFVVVGNSQDYVGIITTSADSLAWLTSTNNWNYSCVTADDAGWTAAGEYLLLGFLPTAGLVYSNERGDIFTIGPGVFTPAALAYGNGVYVGVEGAESGILLHPSSHPLPFADPSPEGQYWGVTFAFGTFVAVGETGAIINSQTGENWEVNESPTQQNLRDVGATNHRFVAVGDEGTILLSPIQAHP